MAIRPHALPSRRVAVRRSGAALLFVVGLMVVATIAAAVWYFALRKDKTDETGPLLTAVSRGPYEHQVVEQGEVESSSNVELRCDVKSRSGGGGPSTSVLEAVPEGTVVVPKGMKTAPDQVEVGDVLIKLDSSSLEQELVQQQIIVNTSNAIVSRAKNTYEAALIAKKEYLEGTFKQEEQVIQNEIYVAEENLRRAQETAKFSERLAARGYLTPLQLEGDLFSVEKYRNELDAAKTKLRVLRDYTLEKMLKQFDSDIDSARVERENEQESYQLEQEKLAEIRDQIAKCEIRAPEPGTVVYANVVSSRGNSEFILEPGAAVRERQVLIRLPDPSQMQVKAKINEARITLVKPGMPVTVRIDAFGDELLNGVVTKVSKYAEPSSWWSSNVKQYATEIKILDPPPKIRPGLTAEVRIHVQEVNEALQLPVQAVYEHAGKLYCLVKKGSDYETREIRILSTNDKTVALDESWRDAVQEGEQVVLNPRRYRELLDLPEMGPQTQIAKAGAKSNSALSSDDSPPADGAAANPDANAAGGAAGEPSTAADATAAAQPAADDEATSAGGTPVQVGGGE